ncbi:hypothetical protein AAOE16_01275 [Ekhidna sp. MALMAid0563]|uniref:hypothetical protein n=1 Tax=Ekhidna sp. MALMAid0563 TaxID=3143937 RepID=UPI0032DFA3C9
MEEKLEKLQDKVNRLTNIAWVLGTLAVIFGLGGGFGIKTILEANSRITELNTEVENLDEKINNSNDLFIKYRKEQEAEFDKYVDSTKGELVFKAQLNQSLRAINNRITGIRLTATQAPSKSFSCSGTGAVTPKDLIVMYGSKDGTGCGHQNINYFKTLAINIPD